MAVDKVTLALAKTYTNETVIGMGALKGAPCTIKKIEKTNGQNIVTFEWTDTEGGKHTSELIVDDGTPIYVWTAGNHYIYGDLVIYASAFYRCIVENSDVVFDDTKWNELGSPDGNYDIVQNSSLLPARFTAADRKMYYSIADSFFWLWDGSTWVSQQNVTQYTNLPVASSYYNNRIVQYIGITNSNYIQGFFYKCILENGIYKWVEIATQRMDEFTSDQMSALLSLID